MAGRPSNNQLPDNFHIGLQELIPHIASLMATPDATIRFCQSLMMVVAGKLKQHANASSGVAGAQGGSPGGVMGSAAGGPPNSPPGMSMPGNSAGGGAVNPMMASQGAPNLMQGSKSPTPDELRRVLSQNAGA